MVQSFPPRISSHHPLLPSTKCLVQLRISLPWRGQFSGDIKSVVKRKASSGHFLLAYVCTKYKNYCTEMYETCSVLSYNLFRISNVIFCTSISRWLMCNSVFAQIAFLQMENHNLMRGQSFRTIVNCIRTEITFAREFFLIAPDQSKLEVGSRKVVNTKDECR